MSSDWAIVNGLRALWKEGLLQDFTISVGNLQFQVSKSVMAAVSNYFKGMLTNNMAESKDGKVNLKGVGESVMSHLINFIYKNDIGLTMDNAIDVLEGAVFLQMTSAVDVCIDFIVTNLHSSDFFKVLSIFKQHSLDDGIHKLRIFLVDHMSSIVQECQAKSVPFEEVCYIKENWQDSELDLYFFLRKWIDCDWENKEKYTERLMNDVRYCLISEEQIKVVNKLERYSNYKGSWHDLINKAVEYHRLPMHQKVLYNCEQSTLRTVPSIACFLGEPSRYAMVLKSGEKWVNRKDIAFHPDCSMDLATLRTIVVNNFLIVEFSGKMFIYNPCTWSWTALAPMTPVKTGYAWVQHKEYMYTMGGIVQGSYHNGIEAYDFKMNHWSHFTNLRNLRACFDASVYEGNIYVSGGINHGSTNKITNMECLNVESKEWTIKAPMLEAMSNHKMAVMSLFGQPVICVVNDKLQLMYYNTASDQWSWFDYPERAIPTINSASCTVFIQNNTVIFIDDIGDNLRWRNKGIGIMINLPTDGNGVSVKTLNHFLKKPIQGAKRMARCGVLLALPVPEDLPL